MDAVTAKQLFDQCSRVVKSYPAGTCSLPNGYPVAGRGFFPVASGSFHDGRLDAPLTSRAILFVGQDWGSKKNLEAFEIKEGANVDLDSDIKFNTGLNLRKLLEDENVAIPLEQCFFTNALFGVRRAETNTGRSPAWKSEDYVKQCERAFRIQIEAIKPKAIVCLGRDAPSLLTRIFEECRIWNEAPTFKRIDDYCKSILPLTSSLGPTLAGILLHPSLRYRNAWRRRFQDSNGKESTGLQAEVEILRAVWTHVNQLAE